MARQYKVEGTNDYLYVAIGLFALGLWAVRDGWFPTPSRLEKNPLEIVVAFEIPGRVQNAPLEPGQRVAEKQLLVELRKEELTDERDAALAAYEAVQLRLREEGSTAELRAELERVTESLARARDRLLAADVLSPVSGEVLEAAAVRGQWVEPGETAARIRPRDSFYPFNKSLALIAFLAAAVFAVLHQKAK